MITDFFRRKNEITKILQEKNLNFQAKKIVQINILITHFFRIKFTPKISGGTKISGEKSQLQNV